MKLSKSINCISKPSRRDWNIYLQVALTAILEEIIQWYGIHNLTPRSVFEFFFEMFLECAFVVRASLWLAGSATAVINPRSDLDLSPRKHSQSLTIRQVPAGHPQGTSRRPTFTDS